MALNRYEERHIQEFTSLNVTPFYGSTKIVAGTGVRYNLPLTVKANDGYKITSMFGYRSGGYSKYQFTIASDGLSATLTAANVEKLDGAWVPTFDGVVVSTKPPVITIGDDIINLIKGENYTVYLDDDPISSEIELTETTVLKIVADTGYEFDNPYLWLYDGSTVNFQLSEDMAIGIIPKIIEHVDSLKDVEAKITTVFKTPDVLNVNDVYLIDDDIARRVSKESFIVKYGELNIDYSSYVLGLVSLPFNIGDDLIVGEQNVRLSNYDTQIPAIILNSDFIEYDMGVIEIPLVNNDFTDFIGVGAVLHLPYASSVVLDVEYLMGSTINISYKISLYDGTAIINVDSAKSGGSIYNEVVDLNITIPYGNSINTPSRNNPTNIQLGGFNGLFKPYVEIMRTEFTGVDDFFSVPIKDKGVLNGVTGYVEVVGVDLKTTAKGSEKDSIVGLLKDGVIIK